MVARARQSFQFFRQKAWFLGNRKRLSVSFAKTFKNNFS